MMSTVLTLLPLVLGLLISTGGFVYAFALAVRSKHLSTGAIVLGASSILCGIGTIPFLALGWKAVQRATFQAIADGAEPEIARKPMEHYKWAVVATVGGLLVMIVLGRLA